MLAALRSRRALWLVAGVALTALTAGCGRSTEDLIGDVPWQLVSVSADARTVVISHELPHCGAKAGRPVLRETAKAVDITVPELYVELPGDVGCAAMQQFGSEQVRLAAPLGRRPLTQPRGPYGRHPATDPRFGPRPDAPECARLSELPSSAAARDVPWVADRLRTCAASAPAAMRRLPLLQRRATAADQLPDALGAVLAAAPRVLRPAREARRLSVDAPIWLIPGATRSCIARLVSGHAAITSCASSNTLGRRGGFVATTCAPRSTPERISLLGFVPAGVGQVRLVPARGRAQTVHVSGGVWSARRLPYPVDIRYRDVRLRTTYVERSCR